MDRSLAEAITHAITGQTTKVEREPNGYKVDIYDGDRPVGYIQIQFVTTKLDKRWLKPLRQVAKQLGVKPSNLAYVKFTKVEESHRGKGLGVALYLAAIAAAPTKTKYVVSDLVTGTSGSALRVWKSLKRYYTVETGKVDLMRWFAVKV